MKNIFTEHPNEVGENYFQHMGHAIGFCLLLLSLSFKALVHAVFPFCYKTAVSDRILKLSEGIKKGKIRLKKRIKYFPTTIKISCFVYFFFFLFVSI